MAYITWGTFDVAFLASLEPISDTLITHWYERQYSDVASTVSSASKGVLLGPIWTLCSWRRVWAAIKRIYSAWFVLVLHLWKMWHLSYLSTDTIETYFDSHVDLLQRKLQKQSDKLKLAAEEAFKIKDLKIKDLSGDLLAENLEREIKGFKVKVNFVVVSVACCQAETFGLAIDAHDLFGCLLAISKGHPYAWKSFVLPWCHEPSILFPSLCKGTPVRPFFFHPFVVYSTILYSDGSMSRTQFKVSICFRYASISTRSGPGITSCSTSATL